MRHCSRIVIIIAAIALNSPAFAADKVTMSSTNITAFDLDQIVVAPEVQGMGVAAALMTEAKRISPGGLDLYVNTDNLRAIQFYQKHGFVISGEALNWRSGAPVHKMSWRPPAA